MGISVTFNSLVQKMLLRTMLPLVLVTWGFIFSDALSIRNPSPFNLPPSFFPGNFISQISTHLQNRQPSTSCERVKKENKAYVGQAIESFSKAITIMANETVDSFAAARSLVEKVEKDLTTMVKALEASRKETRTAEREARDRSLKLSANIGQLEDKSRHDKETLQKLSKDRESHDKQLASDKKELESYMAKRGILEEKLHRLNEKMSKTRLKAWSCRVKRGIFDSIGSFFSDAANAVVDAAETVGDTAESAAKVVVKNTLCPLEKAMDDMINSIINEIDDTKKQIEGTLTRMRGKQKSISQISGLISKEGKQLTEIAILHLSICPLHFFP